MPIRNPLSKINPIILAVGIGLSVSIPLWVWGVPYSGGDFLYYSRTTNGYNEALHDGNIYPSWIPSTNDSYGDPTSRFYPPGFYITLAVIRFVVSDWYYSYLLIFTLFNVISSLGMFLWAYELTKNRNAALLGSVAFLLAPGHTSELYIAGQYAQYAATCLTPFLLLFIERIFKRNELSDICGAALFLALILYFHLPLAIYCGIILPIYCLILWLQKPQARTLYSVLLTAILSAILSSAYWVMMLSELKWIKSQDIGDWFDYRKQFLFEITNPDSNWWFQNIAIMSLILMVASLILLFKKDRLSWRFFLMCGFSFLMATSLSGPIWSGLPILQQTQFPWRWLSYVALFSAVLLSLAFSHIAKTWKSPQRPVALILAGAIAIPISFSISVTMRGASYYQQDEANTLVDSCVTGESNAVFRPIWMPDKLSDMSTPLQITRQIEIVEWSTERKIFKVAEGSEENARIKLMYYPFWKATTESGEMLETLPDSDGALLVAVPPQSVQISIAFIEPLRSTISTVLSLAGLVICGLVLLIMRKKEDASEARQLSA